MCVVKIDNLSHVRRGEHRPLRRTHTHTREVSSRPLLRHVCRVLQPGAVARARRPHPFIHIRVRAHTHAIRGTAPGSARRARTIASQRLDLRLATGKSRCRVGRRAVGLELCSRTRDRAHVRCHRTRVLVSLLGPIRTGKFFEGARLRHGKARIVGDFEHRIALQAVLEIAVDHG